MNFLVEKVNDVHLSPTPKILKNKHLEYQIVLF